MPAKVPIQEIIDALQMHFEEIACFIDLESGRVECISSATLRDAEDGEPSGLLPEWQKRERETAERIVSTDRFVALPSQFDVDEWSMMQEFALSRETERARNGLLGAISGAGAFRRFKEAVRREGIEMEWFSFRDKAFREFAVEWCSENDIAWW